jgi:nucleotide-binding universal stress UspA family protein
MRIRRILVPTDFSDCSEHAIKYAADLALELGARIVVLHVVEPIITGDIYGFGEIAGLEAELRRSATLRVQRTVAQLERRGIRSRGFVESGAAASTILDHGGKSADLIVMGTHGRSGFSHLLMGSIAEKVVRGARCPVLTVRESRAQKPSSRAKSRKPRR